MAAEKNNSRKWLLILLAVAAVSALTGAVIGKYVRSIALEEATVSFSAKLATQITLTEHQTLRKSDGSYELTGETVPPDVVPSYTLIPGLDVPKDPHITIEGKTPIDAYLFVEVRDETPNAAISYEMTARWKKLDIPGRHGGTVFVYAADGAVPAVVDENVGASFTVYLLENNTITVGQKLLSGDSGNALTFYACMGETAFSDKTDPLEQAVEVYQELNK